jgi:hypothetical protein
MKQMGIFDKLSKVSSKSTPKANTLAGTQKVAEEPSRPGRSRATARQALAAEFNEQNYPAEPTIASIVLKRAPEAISIPIDTAEIVITGSIAVVTDPINPPSKAILNGAELDRIAVSDDTVTGVMSVVESISALQLIEQRASEGVLPTAILRRGWWKSWVIGIGSLLLTVASAVAIFVTLSALGAI